MKLIALIIAALAACALAAQEENGQANIYGMQALKIHAATESQRAFVLRYGSELGLDILRASRYLHEPIEVLVAPEQLDVFKAALIAQGIVYEIFVEDVSKVILKELAEQRKSKMQLRSRAGISLRSFPTYTEIKTYLETLAKMRSDVVELFSIGKSSEGRDIVGLKFSSGGKANKPALFLDAGIHAREWIAPSTAVYAIKQLAENPNNSYIFKDIDIYIVPVLNPDGYEYTHKSASTRLWRKTRSVNKGSRCLGVDANRNFEVEWMTVGASSNPCSETYAGSKPFSEPETIALRDFILARKGAIKVYLSFHSYGNYLLHPWGFTSSLPKNVDVLTCAAKHAEKELSKLRGTRYTIGSSTNVLYAAAGGSDDWAMKVAGADLAYTIELPGGSYGFAPPPKEIVPVGAETFEALKQFALYVDGKICQ